MNHRNGFAYNSAHRNGYFFLNFFILVSSQRTRGFDRSHSFLSFILFISLPTVGRDKHAHTIRQRQKNASYATYDIESVRLLI